MWEIQIFLSFLFFHVFTFPFVSGFEKEAKLPAAVAPTLCTLVNFTNLHPVKVVIFFLAFVVYIFVTTPCGYFYYCSL